MKRSILITIALLLIASTPAWSADATAALDLNSAYVWRGITFNDGPVAQPSLDVTHGGFGFNVWGNFDIGDYDDTLDANNFSEIDLTLSYGFSISKLDIGVGLIEYLFPTSLVQGTREIYLSLGMPIIAGLSVGLDTYYDVDETHGLYSSLSVGYAYDATDKLSIEAGASVAYATEEFTLGPDGGLHDYSFSISAGYAVTDALSVAAGMTYVGNFDEDVLPEAPYGNGLDTRTYGGVNISYAF